MKALHKKQKQAKDSDMEKEKLNKKGKDEESGEDELIYEDDNLFRSFISEYKAGKRRIQYKDKDKEKEQEQEKKEDLDSDCNISDESENIRDSNPGITNTCPVGVVLKKKHDYFEESSSSSQNHYKERSGNSKRIQKQHHLNPFKPNIGANYMENYSGVYMKPICSPTSASNYNTDNQFIKRIIHSHHQIKQQHSSHNNKRNFGSDNLKCIIF